MKILMNLLNVEINHQFYNTVVILSKYKIIIYKKSLLVLVLISNFDLN
jgi:hypothetical protein